MGVFFGAHFIGNADFGSAKFSGGANYNEARFSGEAGFSWVDFCIEADFLRTHFGGEANFAAATFGGHSSFARVDFCGYVDFNEAQFGTWTSFWRVQFHGEVDFENAVSSGMFEIDLPESWAQGRIPFRRRGEGAAAFRLAKQSAMDRGDYRLAGRYHYAEQSTICWAGLKGGWDDLAGHREERETARQRATRAGGGLWRFLGALLELGFGRFLFGYGERVRGILISAAGVILGFAAYYAHHGIVETGASTATQRVVTHMVWDCLYFSIVTFTTLGYGDFRPLGGIRLVAASEALIGAFLMALFVVAMARKFTR